MFKNLFIASTITAAVSLGNTQVAAAEESGGHEHQEGEHEEGVVSISREAQESAGVVVQEAAGATLKLVLKVNGRIEPVSSKVAHISPRFPGIIREVKKDIGEYVEAGELLAVVESNTTLQGYEVRASKPGLVTDRHATVGESVQTNEPLFTLMDLSQVWAELTIFQRDVPRVSAGQPVRLRVSGLDAPIEAKLAFISPVVDESTQSRIARAVVSNPDGKLAPGAFVTGEIATGDLNVPVAVREDAIQTIEGKPAVFFVDGDRFKVREVSTGRTDGTLTEVTKGVTVGERYAAGNSFLLKAELGKAEAEHDD